MVLSRVAHSDDLARDLDDETDVLHAIASGDVRQALTLLMRRHGLRIYRYALAMTNDPHLADEIRQRVFVDAFSDLATFRGQSQIRAWLFGIARHRCLDAAKANRRWIRRYKHEPPAVQIAEDCEPDREIDRSYLAKILARCLQKLAPAVHEAVVLRYHQDLSYSEVASLIGDRAGTVQQRVARALPVLRKCVDAQLASGGVK
jgi:RNA polymerase sigma factor (sigma-70 family)